MATNTYVALETQTLTAPISGVAFKSIPQTYTDLRLVISANIASGTNYPFIAFNNDYSALGSNTKIIGNGTSATSASRSNDTVIYLNIALPNNTNRTIWTIDIMNYSSTNVFKTVLWRHSDAANTVEAGVGLKQITAAISQIDISGFSGDWATGSTFSLYGIKAEGASGTKATGGAIYSDSTYFYHVFGATGTFTPTQSITADVLVVAGGGSGGAAMGGGGGAGGLTYYASQSLTATGYTCTVGGGGAAYVGGTPVNSSGTNGTNSQFAALTASVGGGKGGTYSTNNTGSSGGSGGGSTRGAGSVTGGAATSGQGNAGGSHPGGTTVNAGAGGGGAGAAGTNVTSAAGGAGGNGSSAYSSWIIATGVGQVSSGIGYIAGGGGGGTDTAGATSAGGLGGGGLGSYNDRSSGNGQTNTGSGGGGNREITGSFTAGNGGSGVVIIRYAK